jgi:hypothetical protein
VVCADINAKKIKTVHVGSLFGHCLVVCDFNIKRNKPKPYTITHRPFNNIIRSNFDADLRSVRWDQMSALSNVNEKVETLSQHIIIVFDLHAPTKTSIIRGPSYPWITDTVKLMMHMRDQAAADYHKTRAESKRIYYKDLKSLVNKALYHEKSAYFNQNINNNIKNPKNFGKISKPLFYLKKIQNCLLFSTTLTP